MTRVGLRGMQLGIPTKSSGGPLWNPVDDPALAGWWAGDSGTWQDTGGTTPATANGQTVNRWSDLSGNGRHFLDGTHTDGPTLSAAYRAGKNCISFNGTTNMLGANFARAYPCTIYIALFIPSGTTAASRTILNSRVDPGSSAITISPNTTNLVMSNTASISLSSVTLGSWLYLATVFDGVNSSFVLNNSTTSSGNTGSNTQSGLVLSGSPYTYVFGSGAAYTEMIVGEIILIESAHAAAQRTAVYKYLQSRWEA